MKLNIVVPYDPPSEMKIPTLKILYINQFKEETLISLTMKKNRSLLILGKALLNLGGENERSYNISILQFHMYQHYHTFDIDHDRTLDQFLDNGAFLTKSLVSYNMESFLINWQHSGFVKTFQGISNFRNVKRSSIFMLLNEELKHLSLK